MESPSQDRRHTDHRDDTPAPRRALTLRIDLETRSEVWRVIEVDSTVPLETVVQAVQAAMGWRNLHLHEISSSDPRLPRATLTSSTRERGVDPSSVQDEWAVPIGELLRAPAERLRYTYDLTSRHVHQVEVICESERTPGAPRVRFVDGRGACPPDTEPHGFGQAVALAPPIRFDRERALRDVADAEHMPHGRRSIAQIEAAHVAWFVEWVGPGVALTETGRLTPRDVARILEARGWDGPDTPTRGPAGPLAREDHCFPVLSLDERARSLGMVRENDGRLEVTPEGAPLARDVDRLVGLLIERYPRSVVTGLAPRGWAARR